MFPMRSDFLARLWSLLGAEGVELRSAEIASGPMWVVTMKLPNGALLSVHVGLRRDQEVRSEATADDVGARIVRYLREREMVP